jgi:hypothetical protein
LLQRFNAFAVGELLFFAGPKKSNQKKGPYRSRANLYRCGQSRIFGLAIHGSTENGARPARRPPGLDAQIDLEIFSGKSVLMARSCGRFSGRS